MLHILIRESSTLLTTKSRQKFLNINRRDRHSTLKSDPRINNNYWKSCKWNSPLGLFAVTDWFLCPKMIQHGYCIQSNYLCDFLLDWAVQKHAFHHQSINIEQYCYSNYMMARPISTKHSCLIIKQYNNTRQSCQ